MFYNLVVHPGVFKQEHRGRKLALEAFIEVLIV